ncbi:MAG: hypothetical protein ABEJ03_05335 [Candidatus Nanohaloarchaea archaeon]
MDLEETQNEILDPTSSQPMEEWPDPLSDGGNEACRGNLSIGCVRESIKPFQRLSAAQTSPTWL